MSDNSLHNQLKKIKKEKYYEPLCGEKIRKAQIDKAKDMFLKNYFFENGSLENLKSLIQDKSIEREFLQHKMDCYTTIQMDVPATDKKKLCEFQGGDYEQARMDCERLINNCGWELLETVGKQLSHPDMIRSIEFVQELIESIKTCIQTRLRQLKDVETVLVVEQTERRTEFRDVQSSWFEDAVLNNPKEYSEFIKRFDAIIYRILQNNTVDSWNELLQVCYDAIRHTAYSNNDYLNRVGEECMTNAQRASEFAMVVENSWLYTLRFLNFDKTKDATCIIGDSRNCFCKKLRDRFNGTLFDFNGFDRIDVLHISGAFSPENILEWEQIESIGKGA